MNIGPAVAEPAVSIELAAEILRTHTRLLGRFVHAKPNSLRGEIRRYRSLLRQLCDWAERDAELWPLAHRARWWEAYWFEREFGDSQFERFLPESSALELEREFNRRHLGLVAPLISADALRSDLVEFALGRSSDLTSLAQLAANPGLHNIRILIERATPAIRMHLNRCIENVLRDVREMDMTSEFLDFLDQLPTFKVTTRERGLSVLLQDGAAVALPASRSSDAWKRHEKMRRQYQTQLEEELKTDLPDLLKLVTERAAA